MGDFQSDSLIQRLLKASSTAGVVYLVTEPCKNIVAFWLLVAEPMHKWALVAVRGSDTCSIPPLNYTRLKQIGDDEN